MITLEQILLQHPKVPFIKGIKTLRDFDQIRSNTLIPWGFTMVNFTRIKLMQNHRRIQTMETMVVEVFDDVRFVSLPTKIYMGYMLPPNINYAIFTIFLSIIM